MCEHLFPLTEKVSALVSFRSFLFIVDTFISLVENPFTLFSILIMAHRKFYCSNRITLNLSLSFIHFLSVTSVCLSNVIPEKHLSTFGDNSVRLNIGIESVPLPPEPVTQLLHDEGGRKFATAFLHSSSFLLKSHP